MRRAIWASIAAVVISVPAYADMRETTTTTTYSGTVSQVSPSSSTIVVKSETGPEAEYSFNNKTVWLDSAGNVVRSESVQHQPVTLFYEKQGDTMVVTKVVTRNPLPKVMERNTTTTTTTQPVPQPRVIEKQTTTTTTDHEE